MIPKIIHYCWFGGNSKPVEVNQYIASWHKHLPDYKIIEWNENNFDINSVVWVREAIESHKYAFATDYVRLFALYQYGGIYMDTDVEVLRSFNDLLHLPYFIGAENTIHGINTATIGTLPKAKWIKQCMEHYIDRHFIRRNQLDMRVNPELIKDMLIKNNYLINSIASIEEFNSEENIFNIFPATWFSPLKQGFNYQDNTTYTIHHYMATWGDKKNIYQKIVLRIKEILKKILPNLITKAILKKKKERRDSIFDDY